MLRKATQDDLPALVALRCKAARTNRTDAAGWLQNVAGLENILLLVKSGAPPAAMLAASGSAAWQGSRASRSTVCCPNCWKAACATI